MRVNQGRSNRLRIGIFAHTLPTAKPRGAARYYRSLVELLVRRAPEDWSIECILNRYVGGSAARDQDREVGTVSAEQWLATHPIDSERGGPPGQRTGTLKSAWVERTHKIARRLAGRVPPQWKFPVQRRLDQRSAHQQATVTRLWQDFDVVLNFSWFHCPEVVFPAPQASGGPEVLWWFLDAIPLRVSLGAAGQLTPEFFERRVRENLGRASRVVALTRQSASDLNQWFGTDRKVCDVLPCVVTQRERSGRPPRDREAPVSPVKLVILGIQEPSKNVFRILSATRELANRRPECKFRVDVIGESFPLPPEARFERVLLGKPANLEVRYLGYQSDREVADLLSRADALAYPTLWEGFGIPPLEALSSGTIPVVSAFGAPSEVCQEFAIYVDPYDVGSIADGLDKAISMSEEERKIWIARSRPLLERYSEDAVWNIFQNIISKNRSTN